MKIGEALTDEIMVTVSRQAFEFVKQEDPKWQSAIALQTLLYVCVDAREEAPPVSVIGELAWNYVSAAPLEAAKEISGGAFITLAIAWAYSIYLTTRMSEDNLLRCFFTSVGLPAIFVATAQISQAVN